MSLWIERHKNILDFAVSSLLRRKWNNISLFCVYTLVVFMLGSVMFFTHSVKEEASLLLKNAPEMVIQRISAGRHTPIPAHYMDRIKDIMGIQAITGRLWGYYYDSVTGANYTLMVQEDFSNERGQIEIGQGVSMSRLVFEGDTIEFKAQDGEIRHFQVKKVLPQESELISSDLVLIGEADFRNLFASEEGAFTDVVLRVRNPKELNNIAHKIAERLPDTRQILREEILRTYEAVFNWRGGILILILSGGLLSFLILAWDKASGLTPEERKEIGILKAIGWETSEVILLKYWEGMVISLSSFSFGIVLAYVHVFFSSAPLLQPVLKGWSVLYPSFRLTPFIDAPQIFGLFFLTVVPYTVATVIPIWRAATVDPDSVMR
jgi:ABC-type lipoprotein release transport system permease subunit